MAALSGRSSLAPVAFQFADVDLDQFTDFDRVDFAGLAVADLERKKRTR